MRRSAVRSDRLGFTLVELLVSMGLTLFIMVILVEAFTAGLATFQGLRAMGALQNQARSAMQLLRNDLRFDHFEGARRLSDANFWTDPRREGFFVVRQGSQPGQANPAYKDEGADLDGANNSYLARDHVLHFTTRMTGNRRENFVYDNTAIPNFSTYRRSLLRIAVDAVFGFDIVLPGATTSTFSSQWSEVAYVLVPAKAPQPETIPDSGGVVLHNLYRIGLLVVPFTEDLNKTDPLLNTPIPFDATKFVATSQKNNNGKFYFYSPNDMAKDATLRTFKPDAPMDEANMRGKSLACTNVVSFQIRILKRGATTFEDIPGGTLDTASKNAPGYRVLGIQYILRVYDPALGLTRQVTMVQDM